MMISAELDVLLAGINEQDYKFNHSSQKCQQGVKQALLLDLIDHNSRECYISELETSHVIYALEPGKFTNERHGWLVSDGHIVVVTDGEKLFSYPNANITKTGADIILIKGRTHKDTLENAHDGRHAISFTFGAGYGNCTNRIMFNDYLIMALLANEDNRQTLYNAILTDNFDSTTLVINHKNNDSRDMSIANLEYCTEEENTLHGQFIKMIKLSERLNWLLGDTYYVNKSKANSKGYWKQALKIRVSAHDVGKFMDEMVNNAEQFIYDTYGVRKEDLV